MKRLGPQLEHGAILAVSGGPDSTALARLAAAVRDDRGSAVRLPRLWLAHVHHGLRGAEADADAAFVEALARELSMGFTVDRVDVPVEAGRRGESIERTARELRYEALGARAAELEAAVVLTGHTADDQQETVLLRIARGTGIRGLAGMPFSRPLDAGRPNGPLLARPLLDWSRREVIELLSELRQPFCDDASNADTSIPRNAVRQLVLPALREHVHPGAPEALLRLAEQAREVAALLEERGAEAAAALQRPRDADGGVAFSRAGLTLLAPATREALLRRALDEDSRRVGVEPPGLYGSQLLELQRRLDAGSRDPMPLGGGWRIELGRDTVRLRAPGSAAS